MRKDLKESDLLVGINSLKDDGNDGHKLSVMCDILYVLNQNVRRIADALEKLVPQTVVKKRYIALCEDCESEFETNNKDRTTCKACTASNENRG